MGCSCLGVDILNSLDMLHDFWSLAYYIIWCVVMNIYDEHD